MNSSINNTKEILVVANVSFKYEAFGSETLRWDDLSLRIEAGEVSTILGESGVGKTTLLRIISGILSPDKGLVFLNNESNVIKQPLSPIFVVFQDYNSTLLPWLTVEQNILLGQYKTGQKVTDEFLAEIVENLFKEYCSKEDQNAFLRSYPSKYSGGQRQRIQIARALVSNSKFIMLDEPDSAVDFKTKSLIREYIKYLSKVKKIGVVVITHDVESAIAFSDTIYGLTRKNKKAELYDFKVPTSISKLNTYKEVIESQSFQGFKSTIIDKIYA